MTHLGNYINRKWNMFKDLFRDKNDINEKAIVGFLAFIVMILFAIVDIVAGLFVPDYSIHEFIFSAFLWLVLGCFGIAEIGAILGSNKNKSTEPPEGKTKKPPQLLNDSSNNDELG
jgi:hypothetical protein